MDVDAICISGISLLMQSLSMLSGVRVIFFLWMWRLRHWHSCSMLHCAWLAFSQGWLFRFTKVGLRLIWWNIGVWSSKNVAFLDLIFLCRIIDRLVMRYCQFPYFLRLAQHISVWQRNICIVQRVAWSHGSACMVIGVLSREISWFSFCPIASSRAKQASLALLAINSPPPNPWRGE